jgi:hypothetical protein
VGQDRNAEDLMMGQERAGLSGHWKDELAALQDGLRALQQERQHTLASLPSADLGVAHVPVRKIAPGEDMVIEATLSGGDPNTRVQVGYRSATGAYRRVDMAMSEPHLYRATIPGSEVRKGLAYAITAVGQTGQRVTFPADGEFSPIAVTVTDDDEPPTVRHAPISRAEPNRPLTVTAQVRDPSGIEWVRLRYRSVTQYQDFRAIEMHPTGAPDEYRAVVPAQHLDPQWNFMYLIEAVDRSGNGCIYPDLDYDSPYIVIRLERNISAP